jgi:putative glutamine amidotransferase
VIAITPWLRSLPTALGAQTALYTLDPAYAACVAAAGALATIVTHAGDAAAALAGADGLVLSGGSDVHPGSYGSGHAVTEADVSAAVDRWELELLAEARRRRLPTLGICRGMQLLAVAHGGTLVQHLDDESHPGMGVLRPEETLARRHHVDLVASSTLAAILGTDRIQVNTIHHQGVDDPGSLRVSATGPSGVVEAVESEDWPALGVQWHPEKMHEPEQRRLFEYLTDQAR